MLRTEFDSRRRRWVLCVMTIGPAAESDLAGIRSMLMDAGLPVADLNTAAVRFWVARDAAEISGAVGVETFGNAGLLRSLVVAPGGRTHGTGSALVCAAEASMRMNGLQSLVLLTQSAEAFFEKRGYVRTPREKIPERIRQSGEFKTLCPASAVCMSKSL